MAKKPTGKKKEVAEKPAADTANGTVPAEAVTSTEPTEAVVDADVSAEAPVEKPAKAAKAKAPKAEKPEKAPRVKQEHKNGVTRPKPETIIGQLWTIADEVSQSKGRPAFHDEVIPRFLETVPGATKTTANTQYARWKRFYGVKETIKAHKADQFAKAKAEANQKKAEAKAQAEVAKAAQKKAEKGDTPQPQPVNPASSTENVTETIAA